MSNCPSTVESADSSIARLILVGIAGIRQAMRGPRTNAELIADVLALLGSVRTNDAVLASALADASLKVTQCFAMVAGSSQSVVRENNSGKAEIISDRPVEPEPNEDDLDGASKAEAAIAVIRDVGAPCGPAEIIAAFKERDLAHLTGENAISSLIKALIRRAKHSGDVFKVPGTVGKWDLTEHYDPTRLAMLLSAEVIGQDVAKQRQSQRTKDGLARARKRGTRIGAGIKITREEAIEFKRLLRAGAKKSEICERFNISTGSFYNYKERLENWDEASGPWPPAEVQKKQQTLLRVVGEQ